MEKKTAKGRLNPDGKKLILTLSIVVVLYFLIDYYNLPSRIGFDVNNINTDFLGIFCNALVAAVIFALTYLYVERRSVQQAKAQKMVLLNFLKQAYETCEMFLSSFTLHSQRGEAIPAPSNLNGREDPYGVADYYLGIIYEQEPFYLEYLRSGIVSSEIITAYFSVKEQFKSTIAFSALYGGLTEDFKPDYSHLQEEVAAAKQAVEEELEKE